MGGRLQDPIPRRHVAACGRCRLVSLWACRRLPAAVNGRGTSPRDHVHGRGPDWPTSRRVHPVNALPLKVCKVGQLVGQLVRCHLLEHVAISEI